MNINNSKYIFYAFNKKWKSIRECCKYYEVRYGSVMSYKRIHKCTAEEAIAYCRNLKKLGIFYFKKVRWTDLKECCDYYNINYKSLCTYMQKNKISKEEALSHYYQYYKYNRFTYNHVTYDSFAACCEAYNIKSVCVRRYARKKHFLLRHAFASYLNYHNKRKMYFCGQEYITFTSCCRAFGCNASYVSAYAKRHGISREEALKFYINRIEKQEGQKIDSRTFVFRDSIYHDLSDCCHKLGINVSSVYGYMWRTKKGKVEAVEYYYNKKMEDYFEWESVLYSSLSACCTKFDVSLKAVRNRAWRKNCSIQEALLYNEELYLTAYQNIYSNDGSMTKGTDKQTVDGMSIERIRKIIVSLKDESYQPKPARRTYIPKKNGKMRPLGIPSFEDKLLQEVIRMILEAIYEGHFENTSHGFRPNRSCHTALNEIQKTFTGVKCFIPN